MIKHTPIIFVASLISLPAWADVAPIEPSPCEAKKASDSCTLPGGENGTCQDAKCTRLDYSKGPPPTTVEYACLKCVQGPAAGSTSPTGTTDATNSTPSRRSLGCSSVPKGLLALVALLLLGLRLHSRKA